MNATIISYSHTGNNEALATSLAAALEAEHVRVTEEKSRTMGTIVMDILFNRTPSVDFSAESVAQHDLVLFVGPVWMGHVATPLRACFKQLRDKIDRYAFVSISGGADGPNPKLADELKKRLGKEPVAVIDMHIADLLPQEPKPTRDDTSAYRINESDTKHLTDTVVATLQEVT